MGAERPVDTKGMEGSLSASAVSGQDFVPDPATNGENRHPTHEMGPARLHQPGPSDTTSGSEPPPRPHSRRRFRTTSRPRALFRVRALGLRGRATLAFAAAALVLSSVLGALAWVTVSGYLLQKREEQAVTQTTLNVQHLRDSLTSPGLSRSQLLAQLPHEIGSASLLLADGRWSTTSLDIDRGTLPAELRERVLGGEPLHQRIGTGQGIRLVVGLPLESPGEAYFEVFPLDELDQTLRTLGGTLLITMVAVSVGSMLLGRWAMRPALRPLEQVSRAAADIAAGNLSARLDPHQDPALASIAESFNQTAAALERRVLVDAKFAADVSHELLSPLTTVLGAVDLIDAHRSALPAQGQESLDILQGAVARFGKLVADLLEISRVDAGSADLTWDEVFLGDLVERSIPDRLRDRLHVASDARALVRVDKRRLERVVMNLVDNAEQHAGGVTAVLVTAEGDRARVTVEDGGRGIDPGERQMIFDRFARGRGSDRDNTDGAGLGLSLVARHVSLMDGSVTLDDVPGGGSRFTVSLPTVQDGTSVTATDE